MKVTSVLVQNVKSYKTLGSYLKKGNEEGEEGGMRGYWQAKLGKSQCISLLYSGPKSNQRKCKAMWHYLPGAENVGKDLNEYLSTVYSIGRIHSLRAL